MHPLNIFKFCPKCGSNKFYEQSPVSKKCEVCGFEFFKNPAVGVAAVIFDDEGRMLAVRRTKAPAKGTLDLPGGFVEINETAEESVTREVKEELNIDIEVEKFLFDIPNSYFYCGWDVCPLDFFFECRIKDMSRLNIDLGENSELVFLKREEINLDDFGLDSIRQALKRLLSA